MAKYQPKINNFGCVYIMDETPLYMDMPHNVTLDQRGTQSVEVVSSGHEKTDSLFS